MDFKLESEFEGFFRALLSASLSVLMQYGKILKISLKYGNAFSDALKHDKIFKIVFPEAIVFDKP